MTHEIPLKPKAVRITDTLIRHKWPEEKPKETKGYLVNIPDRKNGNAVMWYWVERDVWGFKDGKTLVTQDYEPTHWWELPEV